MSVLTALTAVAVLYGVLGGRGYGRALALGGSTAAGSALIVGSTAVPTFYAVSLGALMALCVNWLGRLRDGGRPRDLPPGGAALVVFLVWSTMVTLIAPIVFDGQPLVSPTASALVAGVVTTSNVAQIVYLALGVAVVLFLARSRHARPELVGFAAGTCTLLSLWRYLALNFGLPFPEGVFDNSPSFAYIETAAGGIERFRGVLSEPAGLAGSSLVTIAYMLPRSLQVRGWRLAGVLAMIAAAFFLGIVSTSATFVVAGLVSLAVMSGTALVGFVAHRWTLDRAIGLLMALLTAAAFWVVPLVLTFVNSTIGDKLASTSYTERSSANSDSVGVFLDTWGFGVGLGSARASSFLPTLLSATGLIGTLLFLAAVGGLVVRGARRRACRPVVWAVVTLLITKVAAGPDLSDTSGVLWIGLGVLSHAVLTRGPRGVRPRNGIPTPARRLDVGW